MKNTLFVILFLLLSISFFSQNSNVVGVEENYGVTFAGSGFIINPPNDIVGSPYLFKDWNNRNYVHLLYGSKAKETVTINNINLNVQLNKFATKLDDAKILSFNQDYFDYVIINNRRFEFFNDFDSNSKKIYEIIGKINDKIIVKGFSTYIIKNKANGLQTSDSVDKIKIKSQYFVKEGNSLIKIKLKKKTIMSLMENKQKEIMSFVKKEKLSFKKEKDLRVIFRYYNSL